MISIELTGWYTTRAHLRSSFFFAVFAVMMSNDPFTMDKDVIGSFGSYALQWSL